MDMDSEINACLDILAEFSTQQDPNTHVPFQVVYNDKPTDNEVKIIKQQLQQWVKLNKLDQRIFRIFRNTLKYGDQVFVRDPETFELFWVEMSKVTKVIVNESKGKEPEQYVLKEINPNFKNLTATQVTTSDTFMNHPQTGGANGSYVQPNTPYANASTSPISDSIPPGVIPTLRNPTSPAAISSESPFSSAHILSFSAISSSLFLFAIAMLSILCLSSAFWDSIFLCLVILLRYIKA